MGCKTDSIAKGAKEDWPKDYKVPNLGMDHDIKNSITNMDNTEKKLGTWTLPKEDAKVQIKGDDMKPSAA